MTALDGAFSRSKAKKFAQASRNHAEAYEALERDAEASVEESTSEEDRIAAMGCVLIARRNVLHFRAIAEGYERVARGEAP